MPSFGEELRREREVRRISLREIADATKINARHLEALENNDFHHLPGGLYNRGFVREYCKYIGADAEAMVNAYLMEEQAQTEGRQRPEGRKRGRSGRDAPQRDAVRTRPARGWPTWGNWLLLLLALTALTVGAFLWLRATRDRPAADAGRSSRDTAAGPTRVREVRV